MLKRSVATLGFGFILACNGGPTPSETVELLVEAIRARDSAEVARFIDIQRVAESAVDPLIQAAMQMDMDDPDRFRGQTGGMGIEMLEQFKPMIAPMMEQLFWQMMIRPESISEGPIGQILGDRPLPVAEIGEAYRGVTEERMDGDDAIVSIELDHESTDRSVVLDMRLEQGEDGWQVVSFDNLQDAISNILATVDR